MNYLKVLLVVMVTLSVISVNGKDIGRVVPIKSTVADTVKVGQDSATKRVTADLCSETHIDYNVRDIIRLTLEPGMLGVSGDTSVSVTVRIKNGNNPDVIKTLYINTLQKATSKTYVQEALYQFSGSLDYELSIIGIEINGQSVTSLPLYVSVIGEITGDRVIAFQAASATSCSNGLINTCDAVMKDIRINWHNLTGAEEYQLEWTFVNDYKGFNNQGVMEYLSESELTYDFKNNSTRISTTNLEYQITNIYEHGYLLYRVRGVGRDFNNPDQQIFGAWSIANATATVNQIPIGYGKFFIESVHEGDKNWQYAATYAEEGKKKEVISYFDGSLRNRQSVTKTNTDNTVLVGQTIYDSQGRPAVNVLPVPVSECSGDPTLVEPIKYYNNFNRNENDEPYNYLNFEKEDQPCSSPADSMKTTSGASNYYSSSNTLKDRQQAYLPDAGGYPFTQIRYTPDNTGRVTRQSGVGPEFKMNSGREIANFYGQPEQIQLDRMFGSEAGDASHYKKNMVIDANGQASISYLNQEGKVVATSLTGAAPDGISALDGFVNPTGLGSDLFKKDDHGVSLVNKVSDDEYSIVFSKQILVAGSASEYTFNYGLNVSDYKDECMPADMCFSCVYNLQIMVTDECGAIVKDENESDAYAQDKFIGSFQTNSNGEVVLDTACTSGSEHLYTYVPAPIKVRLNRGVYTLSKVLTINKKALEYYVDEYIEYLDTTNTNCKKTLSDFQEAALADVSLSDCSVTCEECEASLGTREDWVAQNKGTAMEWDRLYEQCGAPCRQKDLCEGSYLMMLNDVSPNGQYGRHEIGSTGAVVLDLYSLMNDNNQFGSTKNWRHPKIKINDFEYDMYTDASGSPAKVELHQNESGNWLPAPRSGITLVADEEGRMFIDPQDLAEVSDFIAAWQSSWAKSLVKYHPEYCQYEQCSKNAKSFAPTYDITSDEFDQLLLNTTTFKQALHQKLIQETTGPDYHLAPFYEQSSSHAYDPYAVPNSLYTSHSSMLAGKFTNHTDGLSIEQLATYAIRYGTHYGHTPVPNDYENFGYHYDDSQDINTVCDKEWNLAKNIYLSEKRKIQEQETILACEGGLDFAWITAHGKTPRFYGQVNMPAEVSQTEESTINEIYIQTGLCPMAYNMMNFLSAMANAQTLDHDADLDLFSEFTERLYDAIPHGTDFSLVKWLVMDNSNDQLQITLRNTENNERALTITKPSGRIWSEIEGIQELRITSSNGGTYFFTAQARVYNSANTNDPYSYFPITGSTEYRYSQLYRTGCIRTERPCCRFAKFMECISR